MIAAKIESNDPERITTIHWPFTDENLKWMKTDVYLAAYVEENGEHITILDAHKDVQNLLESAEVVHVHKENAMRNGIMFTVTLYRIPELKEFPYDYLVGDFIMLDVMKDNRWVKGVRKVFHLD